MRTKSEAFFWSALLVTSTVAPILHASSDDGVVQEAASSYQDILDSLDAVRAGVQITDALEDRPIPYRSWGAIQVEVYECLFDDDYSLTQAVYELDAEVDGSTGGQVVSGSTAAGHDFDLAVHHVIHMPNSIGLWGLDEAQSLQDIHANLAIVYATLQTDRCAMDVVVNLWQYDSEDGSRGRFIEVIDILDSEFISILDEWQTLAVEGVEHDGFDLPFMSCEQAFAAYDRTYAIALGSAKKALDDCVVDAMLEYSLGLGLCTAGALTLTLFTAGAGGPGGLIAVLSCAAGLHGKQLLDIRKCNNAFKNAANTARATRAAQRQAARDVFGDDCPGEPV